MPNRAGRGGEAGDDDADRGVAVVQVDRSAADDVQDARRRRRVRAAVHAGDDRREARSGRAGGRLRPRRRLLCRTRTSTGRATSASTCSTTCWRRAATSCSTSTTAPAPATAATGARRSTATWAARISTTSSTARSIWSTTQQVNAEAHRRLRRQLRRLHHADGDVHDAGRLRRRRRAAAGHRLGALQPRLHVEHPQRAADRRRGVPQELADLLRATD